MFTWKKLGLVFAASGQHDWMNAYITPAAAVVLESTIRVFISTRSKPDLQGNFVSNSSFIDLDKSDLTKVVYVHDKLILNCGRPGTFDEYGVMVAKPVAHGGKIYLYYMGWQRLSGDPIPYQVALGLAVSDDNGMTFAKVSEGPIVGIDLYDPVSIGNVSVMVEDGLWRMWYTTYTRWALDGQKPTPVYNIKYAYSRDGVQWTKTNRVAIDEDAMGGVATPSVIHYGGLYHMWFGYRPPYVGHGKISGYNIGYASSPDGLRWSRDDARSGIAASPAGWDSDMVCYPHVINVNGRLLMLYSGNHFGRDGFGIAEKVK